MARITPFPGSHEPLNIFQDDMFDPTAPMTSHAPMPTVTKPNRRPLGSSNANVIFHAPNAPTSGLSPHKGRSSSPRSPLRSNPYGNRLNMVPMAPPMGKMPATDSLQKRPQLSNFKTGPQKHHFDMMNYGKENIHPQIFPPPATINLSVNNFCHKPGGKRVLMEAPQFKDARLLKKPKSEGPDLPPHDSFPAITDDGNKPPHSYAQLIGMAILRSPMRRLTLAQIYKWISDHYSFYGPTDAGWQNSIRHNLSLHKNFIKIERPKDDPGKGNYWGIEPGTEGQFLKEKATRKAAPTAENLPVMSTRMEPSRPVTMSLQEPTLPPPPPPPTIVQYAALPPLPTSQATLPVPAEHSSDATIPVSEDSGDKAVEKDVGGDSRSFSPLPDNMHSSPPVQRHVETRTGTPPPMASNPLSSVSRPHKRNFVSAEDSGYISSLESSVMRPNQKAMLLTSEADRPRLKRGRAEEEIARLRNSSPFSPTKSRSFANFGPVSSSPLRRSNEHQLLPPLTPIVKMKPPVRPPPSASPNTNLRIHRDKMSRMLQSPLRRVSAFGEEGNVDWSPAFNLDHTVYAFDLAAPAGFDIFQDFPSMDDPAFPEMDSADTGSPVKRPAKRARMDRTASASTPGKVTNSAARKSITSVPLLKSAENSPERTLETPSKFLEGLDSPSRLFQGSPCRFASPSKFSSMLDDVTFDGDWSACMDANNFDAGNTDFGGLDILQGFEKIGSGSQASKQPSKPPLGRSFTTNF